MAGIHRRQVTLGLGAAAVLAPTALATMAKAQEIRVQNGAAMAGVSQVVIGSFVVAFLTERTDSARAGGGLLGGGFGGRSSARSTLAGVTDAEFQAATDAAYADFLAQLRTAGYEVADRAAWVAAMTRSSPDENGREQGVIMARESRAESRLFSPTALGGPMMPRESLGHLMGRGIGQNASGIHMSANSQTYARETGQAVLSAFYVVDFANAETYGGWFRNSSAVSVQAGLALVPDLSMLIAFAPDRRIVTATLKEPVAVGGDFGTFDETTGGGHRAAEIATNVIGILGGVGTRSTKRFTMQADPGRWVQGMQQLSTVANASFLQTIRTGRQGRP